MLGVIVENLEVERTAVLKGKVFPSNKSRRTLNLRAHASTKCADRSARPGLSVSSNHSRPSESCSSRSACAWRIRKYVSLRGDHDPTRCEANVLLRSGCLAFIPWISRGAPNHCTLCQFCKLPRSKSILD